ncbi:MAG: hypothetical protein ABMB14_40055, partial [Myxococcota bacterium]
GDIGRFAGSVTAAAPPRRPIDRSAPVADQLAALEQENEDLRAQLAEARFTGAVAKGQVAAQQGEPSAWPAEPPPGFAPEAFEANLKAEVAKVPGLEVHAIDCSEYPCVATLTTANPAEGWQDQVRTIPQTLTASTYPDANVWMGVSQMEDDAGAVTGAVGLALMPEGTSDAVKTRTNWRAGGLMQELEPPSE